MRRGEEKEEPTVGGKFRKVVARSGGRGKEVGSFLLRGTTETTIFCRAILLSEAECREQRGLHSYQPIQWSDREDVTCEERRDKEKDNEARKLDTVRYHPSLVDT